MKRHTIPAGRQAMPTGRRAFTLVELLVVIAIIGLLSTVAVVTTGTAREKARLNAAKSFATQIDRVGGDSLVGQWDLDEGTGTTAADLSGLGNTGTFVGSPTWSTDTPSGSGTSLATTASNYLSIPDNDNLDVRTGSATRSFWFKTSQTDRGIMLRKSDAANANGILCDIGNTGAGLVSCGVGTYYATTTIRYNDGVWHQLTLTIDRSINTSKVYIDGRLRASADVSAYASTDLNSAGILVFGYSAQGLAGSIDSVHFFNSALTAMDVRKMYLAELANKLMALNK